MALNCIHNELETLTVLTKHAGVVLSSLILCVGRAQHNAIEEERARIAADIHDTVSQSLFGLAYGLNACAEMLPQEPEQTLIVKQQLAEMQPLVFDSGLGDQTFAKGCSRAIA